MESIDRLSRLPVEDWQKLKAVIDSKGLRIVALDLPTSHQGMQDTKGDEFTGRMLGAINSMLVEMMAAIARKDYEQRRERQAQGIQKAQAAENTRAAQSMRACTRGSTSCSLLVLVFALQPGTLTAQPLHC